MFSGDWTEAKTLSQPTFIGFKSGVGCKYLTSISQASIYRPELSVWVTPQTDYCCLLLDAIVGTKIEQHRSGIGCHNNFVKAKDAFSRVRERFWNMRLMMFYLNVSYVPTLRDVGHYKLWNEVMFWFTQIMCYNVLKLVNYSCSSYPTRASYSGQVDEFRNPMKNELKTRPCLKAVFQIIWNTDANFLNLHIHKATKTRGD